MKIAIISDTHWGFTDKADQNNLDMLRMVGAQKPDVLIHAGDDGSHHPSCIEGFWREFRKIPGLEYTPAYVTAGNHQYWWDKASRTVFSIPEMKDYLHNLWGDLGINHLNGRVDKLSDTIFIGAFDSWYAGNIKDIPTNDRDRSPGLDSFNRMQEWGWLQKQSDETFFKCITEFASLKSTNPEVKTILLTHMGFIQEDADNDWKSHNSGVYFGSNRRYEDNLENVDYVVYGHSHSEFKGTAKNGTTKVINVGSDYEKPKFHILEL